MIILSLAVNSYLINSFSLFGCETNRSNCEWLVFLKSWGIRENGLKNPYFGISRRRRRREIVKGFERPFFLIPRDLGKTSHSQFEWFVSHPKRENELNKELFMCMLEDFYEWKFCQPCGKSFFTKWTKGGGHLDPSLYRNLVNWTIFLVFQLEASNSYRALKIWFSWSPGG